MFKILIAEDDPVQRKILRRILESEPDIEVVEAENGQQAMACLRSSSESVSLVLLDLNMPVMDGLTLLEQARRIYLRIPFVVLTGSEKIADAVEAMRLGALDFITKPPQRERLLTSIRNALSLSHLQNEVVRLQEDNAPYSLNDIAALSPGLRFVVDMGRKAASSDIAVLITGESGTGKEVLAHALHRESRRATMSFVPLNCGAIPDNLVESTLFGHEKGAFTGAIARNLGKCREADGGTLFLDEVGELKPETQVKLLRLLQEGEIEPVGSSKVLKVNVRIISATNRPLEKCVAEGSFREDLYYRLQGLPLHIPPLRERKGDIEKLAAHVMARILDDEKKSNLQLSEEAIEAMTHYRWPGNVREMQHILRRVVLLAEGKTIRASDVTCWFQNALPTTRPLSASAAPTIALDTPDGLPKPLEQIEIEIINATMARYDSHIGKVSAALGIGQSTLYKRLQKIPPLASVRHD